MHFIEILIYVFAIIFYKIIMICFININNNVFQIKRNTYFRIHLVSCDLGNYIIHSKFHQLYSTNPVFIFKLRDFINTKGLSVKNK